MRKLLLGSVAAAALIAPAAANSIRCGAPLVDVGNAYDPDPVVLVEVSYDPPSHAWQIFHHLASGDVVARAQQYAIVDRSNARVTRWGGSLNRNRNLYMVGEVVSYRSGEAAYQEWLYDRGQGNRLDMHMVARCRWIAEAPPLATLQPVQPMPAPFPVPVAPAPAGPVQQSGPVQQNGPIVVPPSSNTNTFTIIIPGASPKSEPGS